jgi:hypothetical protein
MTIVNDSFSFSGEFADVWRAAWMGDVAALHTFIHRSDLLTQRDSKGNTGMLCSMFIFCLTACDAALVYAAGYGKESAFNLLLSSSPSWDADQLCRAVTQGSRYGHVKIVSAALQYAMEKHLSPLFDTQVHSDQRREREDFSKSLIVAADVCPST